ncbi:MAG TPA: polysaccharide biosynthesis/export family protein [Nitrospirota bacterium]|nr:polysaccharide biosynthesis/export family protein [Nitrospirota bacterium]
MKKIFYIFLISLITLSCSTLQKSLKDDTGTGIPDADQEVGVVVSEFILGTGDEIEINVYRHDDLNKKVRIPPDGIITLPLIGEVQTKELGIRQLRQKITEGFSVYLVDPQVSVEVTAFKGQKIFVLGEVHNPGVYQMDPPMTILEAISRAGGFTPNGKDESVMLVRGGLEKPELRAVDLKKALKKGDLTQNVPLQRGDVVYVPRTFISNVERAFMHIENILRPVVLLEQGIVLAPRVKDVFTGESGKKDQSIIIIQAP